MAWCVSLSLVLVLSACSSETNSGPDRQVADGYDAGEGDDDGSASDGDILDAGDGSAIDDEGDTGTDNDNEWPEDPGSAGPCAYSSFTTEVQNTADGRKVPVTFFLPFGRPAPYPAVVISHGFEVPASFYQSTAEHLASWCYLSVLCDYQTNTIPPATNDLVADDLVAVVDWLKSEGHPDLNGQVDAERVALVGHSLGGKVSLLASLDHPGLVGAVVGLDPVDSPLPYLLPDRIGEMQAPLLLLGETFSGEHGIGVQYCAPLELNYHQFYLHAPAGLPALEVTFSQAQHMSWVDDLVCGMACLACVDNPEADHAEVRRLSRRYLTAWLERFLRQRSGVTSYLWGDKMDADVASGAVSYEYK